MRIGIVNARPSARDAIRRVILAVPGLSVAWSCGDGIEAVELALRDPPDLIALDIQLPRLSGVEAIRQILAKRPCPILVVTDAVREHIGPVYEAMSLGALDAVDTPSLDACGRLLGEAALTAKIATVSKLIGKPVSALCKLASRMTLQPPLAAPLVLLGASTGGPGALKEILGTLPHDESLSVVIVQHVERSFMSGLASWLSEASRLPVELAVEGQPPTPGKALLANTSDHLILDSRRRLSYTVEPREACFRPSVDVFFSSVAEHWPTPGVAVLLTGMGRDGAKGLFQLYSSGWHTIAQDAQTCVVWGMPRAAAECGAAAEVLPLNQITPAILAHVHKGRP
jgi:two-component system response regulator WspF